MQSYFGLSPTVAAGANSNNGIEMTSLTDHGAQQGANDADTNEQQQAQGAGNQSPGQAEQNAPQQQPTDAQQQLTAEQRAQQAAQLKLERLREAQLREYFQGDEDAIAASKYESALTWRNSVKHFKPALGYAALMAAPVFLEGYQTAVIPGFYGFVPFKTEYGRERDGGMAIRFE